MFSFRERQQNIDSFEKEFYDLVVIGGGINGAGVARDATSRGMKVALIEGSDFAFGTSSRSSKLIHGGLRYLENLELGLVYEALSERRLLFELAPHLVHPLRFVLPIYEHSRVGMFTMGLGMWLYDILSLFEAPKMHERLTRKECLERLPLLDPHKLCGGYAYSDAYMDDDRLVIETLRSAARWGAHCANYMKADGAEFQGGSVCTVLATDFASGRKVRIRGKHFVSTVGPWTDRLGPTLLPNWKPLLRPSKGIHLTFKRDRIPIQDAVVMSSDDQKRVVFCIPRHEMVIIGTTDTDFNDDPASVVSTSSDVDYLLNIVAQYFPGARIQKSDIISSYAGVRPLVDDGAETESKTSREHVILSDPRNITFVTGGKYTTYRLISQQTVEQCLDRFDLSDQARFRHGKTKGPLNPLVTMESWSRRKIFAEKWVRDFDIPGSVAEHLAERHGPEGETILRKYRAGLGAEGLLWQLEFCHAVEETMCLRLSDFVLRRTPLFLADPQHGFEFLPQLKKLAQIRLGLSENDVSRQVELLRAHLAAEMAWKNTNAAVNVPIP